MLFPELNICVYMHPFNVYRCAIRILLNEEVLFSWGILLWKEVFYIFMFLYKTLRENFFNAIVSLSQRDFVILSSIIGYIQMFECVWRSLNIPSFSGLNIFKMKTSREIDWQNYVFYIFLPLKDEHDRAK